MWTRGELKTNAKAVLSGTYWMAFGVTLVYTILAGGIGTASQTTSKSTQAILHENVAMGPEFVALMMMLLVGMSLIMLLSIVFGFFVSRPLSVGLSRFYLINREGKAGFGELFSVFKREYLRTACSLFVVDLIVFLWSLLLIVPGIIKGYEYAMVNYILAENPTLTRKRAMEISSIMTNNEKWEMFVLGLSFMGWNILGALACGVGTFFVTPYIKATDAELYVLQRQKALHSGLVSPEELPGIGKTVI